MDKLNAFVIGASLGCAFGAILALALAPRTGQEMREIVTGHATNLAEDTRDFNTGAAAILRGERLGIL